MTNTAAVDTFLAHYGVRGMRWDHHVAPQNAPFIQRQGGQAQPPSGGQRPQFTPQERADKMAQLIDLIHKSQAAATQQSGEEAKANPSPQATATHAANTAHLAQMAQAAKEATATNTAHKAANAKKPANHPANKAHAAKMTAKAKAAAKAHAAHKAKHPTKKTTTKHPAHKAAVKKPSVKSLSAKDKAALAKLKPAERAALAKLSAKDRAILAKMTPAQKKALSHLSQKQKDALHKAQLASAAKRHKDALARKAAAGNSATKHSDDVDKFLSHFGVKGMHWGVRKAHPRLSSAGSHTLSGAKRTGKFVYKHKKAVLATAYVGQRVYANRHEIAGTAKIVAHIVKVLNEQRKTPQGQEALALGRAYVQGHVIHANDQKTDEFLAHFGVKGMHWGVRRHGGHPGAYAAKVPASSSEDHQTSALIKSKVKVHGGIHALSNDELETVNKRLNLEQSYHRLTAQPANSDKGRAFVNKVISDAKTGINLYNTLNQVGKIATDIHGETKKRQAHQSKKTRNSPLRVVSIK